MIKFTIAQEQKQEVIDYVIESLASVIKSTEAKTLVANCYDKNLEENLRTVIEDEADGFVLDRKGLLGEEPYGYVSDFFDCVLSMIDDVKKKFPEVGIDGFFYAYDFGSWECIMRERFYCTPEDKDVKHIDQLQCLGCMEWIDAADAFETLEDMEIVWLPDDICLYPNNYNNSGDEAVFCFCSEACKEKFESMENEFEEE